MTLKLADIAVRVDPGYGVAGGLHALLHEIAERLDRLAEGGEAELTIDLRSLPLAPVELERLRELLGTGEVDARLSIDGASTVRETGAAGVWWIEHRDAAGHVIAELIEITRVPEILRAASEDIGRSAAALRARLEEPS